MDIRYFRDTLGLQQAHSTTVSGSDVVYHHRSLDEQDSTPILVLIHGYPQSSYMWRHVIPLLPKTTPLFVPDIPGYGLSSPSKSGQDKRAIGTAIIEALRHQLKHTNRRDVILVGHDRGARICHRLAVDGPLIKYNFNVIGTILLDIQPTLTQFRGFGEVANTVNSFHWSFLANVEYATKMIMAQGGGDFCQSLIDRWAGTDRECLAKLRSDGALEIYRGYFSKESVVRFTCEDYRAATDEDVKEQIKDQDEGRKISCKTLVIYSINYVGTRDVKATWTNWMSDAALLDVQAIEKSGHFIAEETPEETAKLISDFIRGLERAS